MRSERLESIISYLFYPDDRRTAPEFLKKRATVAVHSGDLDLFHELLIQGAEGAHALASEKRHQEVAANWKAARKMWPHEPRVLELADLLLE